MRLTTQLVRFAVLLAATAAGAAGCSNSSSGGCTRDVSPTSVTITSAQACKIIEETGIQNFSYGPTCQQVCSSQEKYCVIPSSYVSEAEALNPDAGVSADGGPPALRCPTGPATLTVSCVGEGCS